MQRLVNGDLNNHLYLYVLMLPNSSKLVATLYLGPMKSLWAYIEGMVGISLLPFTSTKSCDLAAWARFGTLILFEARLLLLCMQGVDSGVHFHCGDFVSIVRRYQNDLEKKRGILVGL